MNRCVIQGAGHSIPERVMTSSDIESELQLPTGWIEQRTGIIERRYVSDQQATSDLAIEAGIAAINDAAINRSTLGGLILATSTPDHLLPPTAPHVAQQLGLGPIMAFDMAVACSGFVYGLLTAESLASRLRAPILLIAANVLSRRINPTDAGTRALFADAAGAVIVAPSQDSDRGLLDVVVESQGEDWSCLHIPAGGSREPFTEQSFADTQHLMKIEDGKKAYRYAVEAMERCGRQLLEKHQISASDIDWWIPHQANARILSECQKRLGFHDQQTVSVLATLGNSSAATIPVACSIWQNKTKLKQGDLVLLTAAGAGLTAGAVLLRW